VLRHPGRWFFAVSALVLIVDQATKALVRSELGPHESLAVIDGILAFTRVQNRGAAFGLMPGKITLFVGISMLVLVAVGLFWRYEKPRTWPVVIATALICAGAVGNLIDRVSSGHVTDFFEVLFMQFPVFNIADSAIVVGTGILIAWMLFGLSAEDEEVPPADGVARDEAPTGTDA